MSRSVEWQAAADFNVPVYARARLALSGFPVNLTDFEKSSTEYKAAQEVAERKGESPLDTRLRSFLEKHLADVGGAAWPAEFLELDRFRMARFLSVPSEGNVYKNSVLTSHRVLQGVLHNNKSDRRTTEGVFHVSEGGLPVPPGKISVPKHAFAKMLEIALNPPADMLRLPYFGEAEAKGSMVGLHINALCSPEVRGVSEKKFMELRYFVPAGLISNLDFVESIFGNAGDPRLPQNNLALMPDTFTGTSGMVIVAPHLTGVKKKALGLPFENEDEAYNGGNAFKCSFRTEEGVMVTIIADNYFGYCKKECKTMISFTANLIGQVEEEHAGGALVFPAYDLGEYFQENELVCEPGRYSFADVCKLNGDRMDIKAEGYAIDKNYPHIYYVPEDVLMDVHQLKATWTKDGVEQSMKIQPGRFYIHPSGYKVSMRRQGGSGEWTLVGTVADGCMMHKPSTVSGGGKSEISKSLSDAIILKNFVVSDFERDLEKAEEVLSTNFGKRYKDAAKNKGEESRSILSPSRSVGSVIKLLTPTEEYTEEFNTWLATLTKPVRALVVCVKKYYREEWGNDWKSHFSVDILDGVPGNELLFHRRRMVAQYLRMSVDESGRWNTFRLRQDFVPADKIQVQDDITASVVVAANNLPGVKREGSVKFVENCEYRLFQRPDDAIHKGQDKQTEIDFARRDVFFANYEPLTSAGAVEMFEDVAEYDKFTEPAKKLVQAAVELREGEYFCSSSVLRIVANRVEGSEIKGKMTANPRYLQERLDLQVPDKVYLANIGARLSRKLVSEEPVLFPVDAIAVGRRNNKADHKAGIKALAVYNPLHYQELPEFAIDFIATLSGKSPSTTGFGCEGALTKGPFNALRATADLNAAIVSYILTGLPGLSTACGNIGPNFKVDHDISYWIPEIWSRLKTHERDPKWLIEQGCLEKVNDFDYNGELINASRLGYRITKKFVTDFCGRVFVNPHLVFSDEALRPETQNLQDYAEGIQYIALSQKAEAELYFKDGAIDEAGPQLKGLLEIMAFGKTSEGLGMADAEFRKIFDREALLNSDWYLQRLQTKQRRDIKLYGRQVTDLEAALAGEKAGSVWYGELQTRLAKAQALLANVNSEAYVQSLVGTLGADFLGGK